MKQIIYKDVNVNLFIELVELFKGDGEFFGSGSLYYEGSQFSGKVTIDVNAGETKAYKNIARRAVEIVSKYN